MPCYMESVKTLIVPKQYPGKFTTLEFGIAPEKKPRALAGRCCLDTLVPNYLQCENSGTAASDCHSQEV